MRVKRLVTLALPAMACGFVLLWARYTAARQDAREELAEFECQSGQCAIPKSSLNDLLSAVRASKLSRSEARVHEYQTINGPATLPQCNEACVEAILNAAGKWD